MVELAEGRFPQWHFMAKFINLENLSEEIFDEIDDVKSRASAEIVIEKHKEFLKGFCFFINKWNPDQNARMSVFFNQEVDRLSESVDRMAREYGINYESIPWMQADLFQKRSLAFVYKLAFGACLVAGVIYLIVN